MNFKRGDQIIYIPYHADGDPDHKDSQRGFVTSNREPGNFFCRYWSRHLTGQLRTRANSESTKPEQLILKDTVPQEVVEAWLTILKWEDGLMKAKWIKEERS